MSATNYLETAILNHIFGKVTFSVPTIYIGLSTTDPLEAGSGITEPSGNGYARKQTAPADWNAPSGGSISNSAEMLFSVATGNWGIISHFFISDHATSGNVLLSGVVNSGTPKSIEINDQAKFASGSLIVTVD